MILNVDKLNLTLYSPNLTPDHLFLNPFFYFEKLKTKDKNFTQVYKIYTLDNNFFGTFYFKSYTHKTHLFSIANEQLYTNDWIIKYQTLNETLIINDTKISTIDIALDSNTNWVSRLDAGEKILLQKGFKIKKDIRTYRYMGNAIDRATNAHYRELETRYIGSKKLTRQLTFYDKTNEIKESEKQYILDHYTQNNHNKIDTKKSIHRSEISIKGTMFELQNIKYVLYNISDAKPDILNPNKQIFKAEISPNSYSKLNDNDQLKYQKYTYTKHYNIDILQLTNQDYLLSIFKHFSPLVPQFFDKLYCVKNTIAEITPTTIKKVIYNNTKQKKIINMENKTNAQIDLLNILLQKIENIKNQIQNNTLDCDIVGSYLDTLHIT